MGLKQKESLNAAQTSPSLVIKKLQYFNMTNEPVFETKYQLM